MKLKEYILIGISFIVAGAYLFETGWSKKYSMPIPKSTGLLLGLFGLLVFIFGYFAENKSENKDFYICKNCNKKYKKISVAIEVCPVCNGKLKLVENPQNEDT